MNNAFPTQKLVCPHCKTPNTLFISGDNLVCNNCQKQISGKQLFFEFTGEGQPKNFNLSQWAMEFSPIVSVYEKFWRSMITFPFSDYSWEKQKTIQFLELENCNSVLDLACGPGNFTRIIYKNCGNKNSIVLGTDLSVPMLRKAVANRDKKTENNIFFVKGNVAAWNFAPRSFDRIHCAGALHLFPGISDVFRSVAATLSPDGIFAGATYIQKSEAGKIIKSALEPLLKFHWFSVEELKELSARAGLTGWQHEVQKQGIVFRVRKK